MRRLRADGLRGTVSYSDGQFDDARYSLALVQSAAQTGAEVLNHASVIGFEKNLERKAHRGQCIRPDLRTEFQSQRTGICKRNRSRIRIISASWRILRRSLGCNPARGFISFFLCPPTSVSEALLIPHTEDGRLIFAIPWMNRLLVGTTDTVFRSRRARWSSIAGKRNTCCGI